MLKFLEYVLYIWIIFALSRSLSKIYAVWAFCGFRVWCERKISDKNQRAPLPSSWFFAGFPKRKTREDDALWNYCWPSIYPEDLFTAPASTLPYQWSMNLTTHKPALSFFFPFLFLTGFCSGCLSPPPWLGVKLPAACSSGAQLDLPGHVIVKHSPLRLWPFSLFNLSGVQSQEWRSVFHAVA